MRFAPVILVAFLGVDPWGFDRFGPLRFALVSTLGFGVIAWSLLRRSSTHARLPTWVRGGGGLLATGLVVSSVASDDRWHALVGTPDRHFGLVNWALCAGLFAAAFHGTTAQPTDTSAWTLRAMSLATLGAGVYTIVELLELAAFDLDLANDRVGGPWGQPAFLGAAMTLGIPVSIVQARETSGGARTLGTIAAAVGTIALVTSQSRAAWVALAVVATLLVSLRWREIRDELGPKRSGLAAGTAVGFVILIAGFTPAGARAWSLTDISNGVVAGRVDEWQVGLRALFDTGSLGVFGHGPEGYRTVFGAHVDQAYVMDHSRDTFTDRAHNTLLDVALAGGLVAAAGMAVLFGGLAWLSVRSVRHGDWIDAALGSAILAYCLHSLFLFPLAEVDPVFWILAGVAIARVDGSVDPDASRSTSLVSAIGAGVAGALAIGSAAAGVLDVVADHRIVRATETESAHEALEHADAARSLRPDSIRYHFAAARIAASRPDDLGTVTALERVSDGLRWSPNDPALLHQQSLILTNRARRTVAPEDISAALGPLAALDRIDPNHPEGQQRYGIVLALDGQTELAIEQFEHAAYMTPDQPEALLNLAFVHLGAGDTPAALEALQRARRIAPDDERVRQLIADLERPAEGSG